MGKKAGGRVRIKQVGPKGGANMLNPLADLAIPPDQMVNLPPKMDSKITHCWPLSQTFSMDYSRFVTIYPNYIDSTKSIKQGRRISTSHAVSTPTLSDISEVLQSFSVRHAIQPYKGYSRDMESQWDNCGRILVDFEQCLNKIQVTVFKDCLEGGEIDPEKLFETDDAGDIPNLDDFDDVASEESDEIQEVEQLNKTKLLREIAIRIPNLPSRKKRLLEAKKKAEEEEKKAKEEARAAKIAAHNAAKSKGNSSKTNKKKGKNKKK